MKTVRSVLEQVTSVTENATSLIENITFLVSAIATNPVKTTKALNRANKCEDYSSVLNAVNTLSVVLYSVSFLLGVTGNGLVIWVTGFKMKKTVNTVWFLNLALADFIFTFFIPLSIAYTALGFHWPFGTVLCKINGMMAFLNMYASVFFLTIISIDRCVSVVLPVWSQNHRTTRLASIIALVNWFVALAMSSPSLAFRDTVYRETNITVCYNNYTLSADLRSTETHSPSLMRKKAIVITKFVFGFLIPFVVIVVCYGIITVRIKKNGMATKSRKPFWIITTVIVLFFLCWFPLHVLVFQELTLHKRSSCALTRALQIGLPIATNLAYLHSCVNPVLYVFMGQDAKYKIRKSILKVIESVFKEEASQATRSSRNQSKSMVQTESRFL